jgi:hypothetical protein
MNAEQKKVITYALYGLGAVLVFVFWRLGTQYDYSKSLLIWKLSQTSAPSYLLPTASYGLRLRMGIVGVIFGLILPVVMVSAAAYISKSDDA